MSTLCDKFEVRGERLLMTRYLPSNHAQQAHCYTRLPKSRAIQWLSPSGRVGPVLRSDAPSIRSRKSEDRNDGQALRGVAIQVEAVLLSRRWSFPGGLGAIFSNIRSCTSTPCEAS